MSSARASIFVVFIGLLTACEAASEKAEKAETTKTEPAKVDAGGPYIRCQALLGGQQ